MTEAEEKCNNDTTDNAGEDEEVDGELAGKLNELDEYCNAYRQIIRPETGKITLKTLSTKHTLISASVSNRFKRMTGSAKTHEKSSRSTSASGMNGLKAQAHSASDDSDTPKKFPLGYSHDLVKVMVTYTTAAYCKLHNTSILECGCDPYLPPNFTATLRATHKDYDSSAFVGLQAANGKADGNEHLNRNFIVASFRGTQSNTNWINNLKAIAISAKDEGYPDAKGVKFHLGFWRTFSSISDEVIKEITRLKMEHPDYDVVITGHSLGGALATFCCLLLSLAGIKCTGYTFGQPRAGNVAFREYFNSKVDHFYRIINNYDAVPHLPQRIMGFRHVGVELWFEGDVKGNRVKGRNGDIVSDPMTILQLTAKKQSSVPFHKLTIIDHIVYYERVTGDARLKGQEAPAQQAKRDGRAVFVTDTFMPLSINANQNTVVLLYESKKAQHSTQEEDSKRSKLNRTASLKSFLKSTHIGMSETQHAKSSLKKLAAKYEMDDAVLIAQMDVSENQLPNGAHTWGGGHFPSFWFFPGAWNSFPEGMPVRITGSGGVDDDNETTEQKYMLFGQMANDAVDPSPPSKRPTYKEMCAYVEKNRKEIVLNDTVKGYFRPLQKGIPQNQAPPPVQTDKEEVCPLSASAIVMPGRMPQAT
ncbi:hypothetical protein SARC_08966 [Sphaeroforma arctica JP610]|uniref:Fungal lipase-type domain-containing protein n=1 Tax=Sphaeroforma arctica JP610 TaxID=667725 RepID=A0A0L0FP93_9EUKA|nr:hypothetical protein SARC_08966 [Sphaeroforma arctica JP610]KNC78607.1 hypothetical protein SARC_08966 [Sphaeroforma arctica JP610]|eukprot:XP_014152509.1 hypothetical protein SARC_08966 [Sphaeroforma arctica JP610]